MNQPRRHQQPLNSARVLNFVQAAVGEDLHAKRILSLANGALGVIHSASLAVASIGRSLAQAQGLEAKHAIKQVDRLLSNAGIDVWDVFSLWVPYIVGSRPEVVVTMDWTEFDADDPSTLVICQVTRHGRATPLLWKSVVKSKLKGVQTVVEHELLTRLNEVVPAGVRVTVLADRGFGSAELYAFKWGLGLDHVTRFRGAITVTDTNGVTKPAREWLWPNGNARILRNVTVTAKKVPVDAVVVVWAKGMKEPWFLVCNGATAQGTAASIVKLYGKRFTTEETFRDAKDLRFGMGLSSARVGAPERRDRLLLLSTFAITLLTLLGAAAESLGFDRLLRANTAKKRTHSLFFQGTYFYGAIPAMKMAKLRKLATAFGELLTKTPVFSEVFGVV